MCTVKVNFLQKESNQTIMHEPIKIKLTVSEIRVAAQVGVARKLSSMEKNLNQNESYNYQKAWDYDINGAAAELAFCKWKGIHWSASVDNFTGADVGDDIQIRNAQKDDGSLAIKEHDQNDHVFVLLTGRIPEFTLRGWIRGKDGKKPHWKSNINKGQDTWLVPQEALRKIPERNGKQAPRQSPRQTPRQTPRQYQKGTQQYYGTT